MSAEYVPETGEPLNLLTQENAVALYATMSAGVEVNADHESSWDRKFRTHCQSNQSREISPGSKRRQPMTEKVSSSEKKSKANEEGDKRLCLRNTFGLFKIGAGIGNDVPECTLKDCKFKQVTKRRACPETLEAQMKAIKNKWFTEGNMKALLVAARKSFKG
jgi:hypothetical protein